MLDRVLKPHEIPLSHGTCDLDHLLSISTDSSSIRCTLHVAPVESIKGLDVTALEAFLIGRDILARFIDRAALQRLIDDIIETPKQEHSMVVAQGEQAKNGTSAIYTLTDSIQEQLDAIAKRKDAIDAENTSSAPKSPDPDDADAVNFYDQMAFVVVKKGDPIAYKTESSMGTDGCDVFGATIAAIDGKSNDDVLDQTIRVDGNGLCTAAISGVLSASPLKISISENLEIKGDVDFQTGRITFPGSVTVNGGVKDHFSICADHDITIHGLVECAKIESLRDITLSRGMAGKDTGTIHCVGDLSARYLESTIGVIIGNAQIQSEITNSSINVRGKLNAEQAVIRGGKVLVSKEAVVNSIGSPQGVETTIAIGVLEELEVELRSIDELSAKLETQIKSMTTKKETYSASIAKPTASQIEEMMGMDFELQEYQSRLTKLNDACKIHRELLSKNTTQRLVVNKAIYAKSILFLPGFRVEFKQDLVGESIIELGSVDLPSITFRGQTVPLSEHARVLPDETYLRVIEDAPAQKTAA